MTTFEKSYLGDLKKLKEEKFKKETKKIEYEDWFNGDWFDWFGDEKSTKIDESLKKVLDKWKKAQANPLKMPSPEDIAKGIIGVEPLVPPPGLKKAFDKYRSNDIYHFVINSSDLIYRSFIFRFKKKPPLNLLERFQNKGDVIIKGKSQDVVFTWLKDVGPVRVYTGEGTVNNGPGIFTFELIVDHLDWMK